MALKNFFKFGKKKKKEEEIEETEKIENTKIENKVDKK